MKENLQNLRKTYKKHVLREIVAAEKPMEMFHKWFQEVLQREDVEEPNAMAVATIGTDGYPKNRLVLLKEYDAEGFVFYTNYESEKGRAIAKDNRVCLSFYWPEVERQVIIKGEATKSTAEDSDTYFHSRPKTSQLGVLISKQSHVIPSRDVLDDALEKLEEEYKGKTVPRPDYWGGYKVKPKSIEFWQGRPNRLHDRIRYRMDGENKWLMERLSP